MFVDTLHRVCCHGLSGFDAGGDDGFPCVNPVKQVICPSRGEIFVKLGFVVPHEHAGSVGGENLVLLGVKVFDLRNYFATLGRVLAGLVFAMYKVIALFPELEKLRPNDCDHPGGP